MINKIFENAKAGIDISDANTTVTLENITSQNHLQSGIRVKKGAHVTIKGTHIHENDAQAHVKLSKNPPK